MQVASCSNNESATRPDKLVRAVTLETKQGICVRPIIKVCLLLPKDQQTDVKE